MSLTTVPNALPKLSIITVAYNASAYIEATIETVLAQTYPNIEYIIIDGASKDDTLAKLEPYASRISKIISEPDRNNYDAMNKGFQHATGDYIWFLHAGDLAYGPETVAEIMQGGQDEDFVYGEVKIRKADGQTRPWHKTLPQPKDLTWRSFRNGMVICHQAMWVHRRCWVPYDHETYPLVGDLDWTIRTLQKAKTHRLAQTYFCTFLEGGLSARKRRASWAERWRILQRHFGCWQTLCEHGRITWQALRRGSVKN